MNNEMKKKVIFTYTVKVCLEIKHFLHHVSKHD